MRRLNVAPKDDDLLKYTWFQIATDRLNVYSGSSDPVASEIPENQWIVYHNTTSGEVRLWVNIGGAVKKSAALT